MTQLPIIDLSGLALADPALSDPALLDPTLSDQDQSGPDDNPGLQDIAAKISLAMQNSGFMYIRNHGINDSTIARLKEHQLAFFALPDSEKSKIAINQHNRGYLGPGKARMHGAKKHDQKEVFFWGAELAEDHPDRVAGLPLCGPNQWPDHPAGFRDAVLQYAHEIGECGNRLLKAMAVSLGADANFFEPYYQSSMLRGQLIHYPPTEGGKDDFGVAPHTDFGCITLLLQSTPGLEVLTSSGEWISAPPIAGTLVINVGDLLERWTDGRLPSTRHRVRNLTGADRYSIAMFHDPDPGAIVDANELQLNARNYEPVTAADYISGRNSGAFSHFGQVAEKT